MSDLYDEDILLWSEHQAELLRRLAAGQPVNERPDWANIIDEVENVGREQLHAVESLPFQALLHMLKAEGGRRHAMSRTGCRMRVGFAFRHVGGSCRPCGGISMLLASMATLSRPCLQGWVGSHHKQLLRTVR
jgi:hypothetical protein